MKWSDELEDSHEEHGLGVRGSEGSLDVSLVLSEELGLENDVTGLVDSLHGGEGYVKCQ